MYIDSRILTLVRTYCKTLDADLDYGIYWFRITTEYGMIYVNCETNVMQIEIPGDCFRLQKYAGYGTDYIVDVFEALHKIAIPREEL